LSGVDFFPGDLLSSFYLLRLKSSNREPILFYVDFYLKTLTFGLGFFVFLIGLVFAYRADDDIG